MFTARFSVLGALAGVLVMVLVGCFNDATPKDPKVTTGDPAPVQVTPAPVAETPAPATPAAGAPAPAPVTPAPAPVVATPATPAPTPVAPAATETVSRTIEDGGTGAYKAIMVGDSTLATHTIFRPGDLAALGPNVKLPIVSWGNGGCANSPSGHLNFLSEVASHGYLVIAIGPAQQGARGGAGGGGGSSTSKQLLDAIDWAIAQNANKDSIYYNRIDVAKIAVAGMSCGGLQALEVSPDPRVKTTLVCNSGILGGGAGGAPRGGAPRGGAMGPGTVEQPVLLAAAGGMGGMPGGGMPGAGGARGGAGGGMAGMPALTKDHLARLHSPVLYLLGGESDMAYANGMDDFRRIERIPVFVASMDVGHGGTYMRPHGGEFATVAVAWLNWQLRGDMEAARMFTGNPCGLAKLPIWKIEKKNIP
jgi:hypothetical protein